MRRIQIIVNNGAGTGRAHRVWNETQCLLRGYKIKYEAHMTRYEGHAAKLAEQISRVKGKSLSICWWLGETVRSMKS